MTQHVSPTLTDRDLAMLLSVSEARYLTAEALEWLHFPTWWEQWRKAQAAGRKYQINARVYMRLRALEQAEAIRRIHRPVMLAVSEYKRDSDVFALSEQGAELLSEIRQLDIEDLHPVSARPRSYLPLLHGVAVGRVYAALRTRIAAKSGLSFAGWRGEHETAKAYDRLSVPIPHPNGIKRELLAVQPDGVFWIEHEQGRQLFFVEVERRRALQKWKEKVYAFEAYQGSPELHQRYGAERSVVLGVASSPTHQRRLLEATGEALFALYRDEERRSAAQRRYLVTTLDDVHPESIGMAWQRVRQISRTAQAVTIDTVAHTLIS